MELFFEGQKWLKSHTIHGTFFGEVVEVSDGGGSGTVIITDDRDNVVDTFSGSAGSFLTSGEWQLIEARTREI
jgi:hypothetical protein